jgi:hypothetical protein
LLHRRLQVFEKIQYYRSMINSPVEEESTMIAYAGAGGVMFVPEAIERKAEKKKEVVRIRRSNDNPKSAPVAKEEVLAAAE